MYELIDGQVYKIEEVKTGTQTATFKTLVDNVIYNDETGEFEEIELPTPEPKQTLEQRIDQLQQDNLLLMYGLTDLYEKLGGGQ